MTRLEKPVSRRARVHVPHGVRPDLCVTLYPNGTIGLREAGRPLRTEKTLDLGTLYVAAIQSAVLRVGRRVSELVRNGETRSRARKQARKENGL